MYESGGAGVQQCKCATGRCGNAIAIETAVGSTEAGADDKTAAITGSATRAVTPTATKGVAQVSVGTKAGTEATPSAATTTTCVGRNSDCSS